MIEYRLDIREGDLTSIRLIQGVLSTAKQLGELTEVVKEKTYYLRSNSSLDDLNAQLSRPGVNIMQLKGWFLKRAPQS